MHAESGIKRGNGQMKMYELQEAWQQGKIEKKTYWTLMRENFTHVLPELQRLMRSSGDCESIVISEEGCILKKRSGVKLYFDFTQSMCRAEIDLVMGTDPEKDDIKFVNEFLGNGCKTVLDVGANVGLFSLDLYQSNKNIVYHLFEPLPATYAKLRETAELNDVNPGNYVMHNLGFSNEQGIMEFYFPAESEAASLRPVEDDFYRKRSSEMGEYTGASDMEKVLCQVDTLDHFVEEQGLTGISFIKIDVEGNEKAVLEGAITTIKKERPLIYCELLRKHAKRFGYHPNNVIEYMKYLGYECATIRKGKLEKISCIDDGTVETNFFFLHEQKHKQIYC